MFTFSPRTPKQRPEPPAAPAQPVAIPNDQQTPVFATSFSALSAPTVEQGAQGPYLLPAITRHVCKLLTTVSHRVAGGWLNLAGASFHERWNICHSLLESGRVHLEQLDRYGVSLEEYAVELTRRAGLGAIPALHRTCPLSSICLTRAVAEHLRGHDHSLLPLLVPELFSSRESLEPAAHMIVSEAPLAALEIHRTAPHLLDVHADSLMERAIMEQPLSVQKHYAHLDSLSDAHRLLLAEQLYKADPRILLSSLAALNLGEENTTEFLIEGVHKNLPELLQSLSKNLLPFPAARKVIALECLRSHSSEALEELETLLTWSGSIQLGNSLPLDDMLPYWRRILIHRDTLGLEDSKTVKSLVLAKIDSKAKLVAEHLGQLNLARAPWAAEVGVRLCEKVPTQIPEIVRILRIKDPESLSNIATIFAQNDPRRAMQWMKKLSIAVTDSFFDATLRSSVEKSPWGALLSLRQSNSLDPAKHDFVLLACAHDNSARVSREIVEWKEVPKDLRERLFSVCASRNLWTALEHAQNFDIKGSNIAKTAFFTAIARDAPRAFEFREVLGVTARDDLRRALRCAVAKNATQSMRILMDRTIGEDVRCEAALIAVRRSPAAFLEHRRPLSMHFGGPALRQIIAGAARGDVEVALDHCSSIGSSVLKDCGGAESLIRACALENLSRALRTTPGHLLAPLKEPGFIEQVMAMAIVRGRWNSGLEAAKLTASHGEEEGRMVSALRSLDTVAGLLAQHDLQPGERENLELFLKIRRAGCIPTDTIQQALYHFGPDDHPALLSVLEQAGSTAGESILSVLLRSYPTEFDIRPVDLHIVRESMQQGFRGLSPRMLNQLRPLFERSPLEGRAVIRSYQELANRVLTGKSIPEALERSPLYPGLVTAAFRPVGMTESTVAGLLESVSDHSDHLSRFSFPADGYPIRLAATTDISLRAGEKIAMEEVQGLIAAFRTDSEAGCQLSAPVFVRRLLQGAFDQLTTTSVWEMCQRHSEDPRIPAMRSRLGDPTALSAAPSAVAKTLSYLAEVYGVIGYDACLELAGLSLNPQSPPELSFRLDKKMETHIRRILRLAQTSEIMPADVLRAVEAQLPKVFRNGQNLVNREAKKFTQHIRELGDRYSMYLSKSRASYFGRAGAGLCTAQENWSWNNRDFLQMTMVDQQKAIIVGNVQLHLFKNRAGAPYVLARVNPTATFLTKVDKNVLAKEMLRVVREFASDNRLIPYLPEQSGWHELTNRDGFTRSLQHFYGNKEQASIQITKTKVVTTVFQLKETRQNRS